MAKKTLIVGLIVVFMIGVATYFFPLPKRVKMTYYAKTGVADPSPAIQVEARFYHYLWGNKMDYLEGRFTVSSLS